MATKDDFLKAYTKEIKVQYKENKWHYRTNNDIHKQEQRQVVCQSLKNQGKQRLEEGSGGSQEFTSDKLSGLFKVSCEQCWHLVH